MSCSPADRVYGFVNIPVQEQTVSFEAEFRCSFCNAKLDVHSNHIDWKDPRHQLIVTIYPHKCKGRNKGLVENGSDNSG